MSVEKFAGIVGSVVERKKFLARAGGATAALLGLEGLMAPMAKALYDTHGCTLCNPPGACGPQLNCAWSWPACYNHQTYYCFEGRQQGGNCNSPSCPSYCSWYTGPWSPSC